MRRESTIDLVRMLVRQQLEDGAVAECELAQRLHISTRTLQRELKRQGCNYRMVLDQARHELALQYICQCDLTVDEIAYRLSFAEASSFSRAFKRWTGCRPTTYRERLTNNTNMMRVENDVAS